MKEYYPSYYHTFRCIAADCPDSCCQGWYIVPDDDALLRYSGVKGAFGERLRANLTEDEDGDIVFRLTEDERCPFWAEDRLCDIYRELGEAYLCKICDAYPRLSQDYTAFREHDLALSCPEAARLILSADDAYRGCRPEADPACTAYSYERMTELLRERERLERILTDPSLPVAERLRAALSGDCPTAATADEARKALYALFEKMEYCSDRRREWTLQALKRPYPLDTAHDAIYTRLFAYYLRRYYLTAIGGSDPRATVRMICAAYLVLSALAADGAELITAAQGFSKDIEQSDENMRLIRSAPQAADLLWMMTE